MFAMVYFHVHSPNFVGCGNNHEARQVSMFRESDAGELASYRDSVVGATGSSRPGEGRQG